MSKNTAKEFMGGKTKIIDLFCGLGGWAKGLIDAGHDVTGYDLVDFSAVYPGKFIQSDLLKLNDFPRADAIVASPPCTHFSKSSMPSTWKSVQRYPPDISMGMKLFSRTREIIDAVRPEYYVIENLRGAQKWVGMADFHYGSRYFWSNIGWKLYGDGGDVYGKWKLSPSMDRAAIRSLIPYSISRGLGEYLKLIEIKNGGE